MTEQLPAAPNISEEFYIRVNDFIEMANRIERRFDTGHAEIAMLHAFARYSAHHYRQTAKGDTAEDRVQFAEYIGAQVSHFVKEHLRDMAGEPAQTDDKTA